MKFLCLIIACALHNVYAAQQDVTALSKQALSDLEDEVMEQCRVKHNINKSVLDEMEKSDEEHPKEIPQSKDFKCMMGCFAEEMGYIKDNKPQWDIMHGVHKIEYEKKEDYEKAVQVLETCKKIVPEKEEDNCELGFAMAVCYLAEAEKIGLDLI